MKPTKSILDELTQTSLPCRRELVESRGHHVITSALNLLAVIRENYSMEIAEEIERRLINSIRTSDPSKFSRGVRKLL